MATLAAPMATVRAVPQLKRQASMARRALPALCLLLLLCAACAPARMAPGPGPSDPHLQSETIVMDDGLALPLRRWLPPGDSETRAVVIALHGFNDYSKAFESAGTTWAKDGIATYAYDQRGFGAGPGAGLWAGHERLTADLADAAESIAARHPGLPVYLLGDSMGAAVVLVALTGDMPPQDVAGAILVAPAVWGRATMPVYQRAALWLFARVMPWARFSGRGLKIQASDNIEMLRALGRDPLVIKRTRVDAIDGLTDLMSAALEAGPRFDALALLLYGEKDEIVPKEPVFRFWRDLPAEAATRQRQALYAEGWHMLLRDLQAEVVHEDIAAWIAAPDAALPSGADAQARAALQEIEEAAEAR